MKTLTAFIAHTFFCSALLGQSCPAIPTITSFTPTSGPIGTTVTITGNNFDPIPASNIVFFGATRATVSAATTTSLAVTVPIGATYQFITVTNVCNLTAYSTQPFVTTFSCGGLINSTSFAPKVDFSLIATSPTIDISDIDGDGKSDMVVIGINTVSVFRNISTPGIITTSSFAPKVDFATGIQPLRFYIGDLDGDGKRDLAVSNYSSHTISVLRNTSTPGTISFAPKLDFTVGFWPTSIVIGDLDGDGKSDLATTDGVNGIVSISRNTSSIGTISFAPKIDLTIRVNSTKVIIADLDADSKPDLIIEGGTGVNTVIMIFKNISVSGMILFASRVDIPINSTDIFDFTLGDLDGDSKPDLVVIVPNRIFLLQNITNTGVISTSSFSPSVDLVSSGGSFDIDIGELDGDGKPELVASRITGGIEVFKNMSTPGTITTGSFPNRVVFNTGTPPNSIAIGDIDGDEKSDLAVTDQAFNNTVSVLRNTVNVFVPPSVNISASSTSICSGTSVTFTATPSNGGATPAYQWQVNGNNVGTNSATYTTTALVNGDIVRVIITSNLSCALPPTATSNAITMTVTATGIPSINISASSTTICAGTSVTFTATPANGGATPAYQWQVNGGNVGTNSPIYTTNTLTNGDVVRVILTSTATCASPTSATSNTITMTVTATVTPSVNITASSTTICLGTSVTFTATPTNGGTTPAYQWQVNGGNVGTNSPIYTTNTLINGNVVRVIMTSNLSCASPTAATSNTITMVVNATVTPFVNIAALSTTICTGTSVTFTATPTNGGTTPAYQWQVNGDNVGTNSPIYTTNTLVNGDVVTVIMTSNAACASPTTATSNAITIIVTSSVPASVNIIASATTICIGASVTFTATPTNGGPTPSYQWQVNGSNTGTNSPTHTTNTLVNGDVVRVIMTSGLSCAIGSPATSNSITMTVVPPGPASVNINSTSSAICSGTSVTFTATPTNGGAAPAYQWQVNGVNAGTNSPTYTTSTLSNGDVVTVIMTSSLNCATGSPATSNSITMTVTPSVTPSVNIGASSTAICVGVSVTFNATSANGGTAPAYQWKVNGANVGTNSSSYTTTSLANGDVVTVMITSNATCPSPATVTSGAISMSVSSPVTPAVSITVPTTIICTGSSTTFTATTANVGTIPVYQWQANGVNVGTNSSSYTTSSLANGDVITAIITSNAACATVNTVTSNQITMSVINTVTPIVNIGASPGNICYGTTVTFTAAPTNGGSTPAYQWKLNGSNTGTNSPAFIRNTLTNGDIINCLMTSNAVCAVPNTVASNNITVVIDPAVCPMGFYMLTGFTPNKDGKNDVCKPTLLGNVISYKFSVYNRWGQKIFETTDLQKGWDGKVSGLETDSNVFVWVCTFQFAGQAIENKKGTVVLIR